jgi:hypothetical protein
MRRSCGSCGAPAPYTITLRGKPMPACLRHLNHWRTPSRRRCILNWLKGLWHEECCAKYPYCDHGDYEYHQDYREMR